MKTTNHLTKIIIRIWIAITAVLGFLGGWGFLAHSGKPAPTQNQIPAPSGGQLAPLPTLPPLDFSNNGNTFNPPSFQQLPSFSIPSSGFGLRTGGS